MSRITTIACGPWFRSPNTVAMTTQVTPLRASLTCYSRVLPVRQFSVSQSLTGLSAWDKKKFKGRKPAYLGRAVTKLELVDPDPTLDDEEEKLLADWKKQYEVDMTHCYDLMKEKAVLESLDTGAEKRSVQEERKHHANMMKENDEWNKEVANIREREFAIAFEQQEEEIRVLAAASVEERAARQTEVMAYVSRLQEESASYVTLDNLDEKIEEALNAAVIDYDFSLDRSGNVVKDKQNNAVSA